MQCNFLRRTRIQKMTRLESTVPNDSTCTRPVDFFRKLLESTQLQLVQDILIKNIVVE
jgi:hypothetical protein